MTRPNFHDVEQVGRTAPRMMRGAQRGLDALIPTEPTPPPVSDPIIHEAVRAAFAASINLGEYLRNAEFCLGLLPEKPMSGMDLEAARVHLIDVRGALGQIALHLAEIHANESRPRP